MRICGCVNVVVFPLNETVRPDELPTVNTYDTCKEDLEYRLTCWDNDVLFDEYYDMADFVAETNKLSETDYVKTDELCDYILGKWSNKAPTITKIEFSSMDDEGWVDTIYYVDCDYKEMYKQMKREKGLL